MGFANITAPGRVEAARARKPSRPVSNVDPPLPTQQIQLSNSQVSRAHGFAISPRIHASLALNSCP
jgi:hypothetical protein